MMRGFVVRPSQSSSTAVRPVYTDNDLLDLGHAVTLSLTGFSGSTCNATDLAKLLIVHTCSPDQAALVSRSSHEPGAILHHQELASGQAR